MTDDDSLELADLAERHSGLTPEIGATYAQAAGICLSRHHEPPIVVLISVDEHPGRRYSVGWPTPTDRERAAWNNDDDATRDGAYCLALAAIERALGLVALGRTPSGSGVDYFVGLPGSAVNPVDGLLDFEDVVRLEVSGIGSAQEATRLNRRVREKVEQARRGRGDSPAIAGVVAFSLARVVFRNVV